MSNMHDKKRQALLQMMDVSHWREICAFTFNFESTLYTPDGRQRLDEHICQKELRHFLNKLNRLLFRGAYRHRKVRLRVIPILERSAGGHWHYHAAIEPPAGVPINTFTEFVMTLWEMTPLGTGHGAHEVGADHGWLRYMAKLRSKSHFEDFFDCIDTVNYNNPVGCR